PGCTIFSVTFSNEGIEEVAVLTAGTREDNVASATARRASARRVILPDAPSSPKNFLQKYLISK
ncbi:hypothetical protein NM976_00190, partial [Escherichia coli]|nr:hypothetical protein [Escherichia coli]